MAGVVTNHTTEATDRLRDVQERLRAELERYPHIADLFLEWLSVRYGTREAQCQTK